MQSPGNYRSAEPSPGTVAVAADRMRTLLICHDRALLDQHGMARWLASFSEFAGMIVLQETKGRVLRRIRHEIQRVGVWRFWDILLLRLYHHLFLRRKDGEWEKQKLGDLFSRYPELASDVPVLRAHSPNTPEAEQFIRELNPHIVIARCKTLLKERIFSLARTGTFVMHPGICPEYRNAHGCFWALAKGDLENVGMTLLRIDRGVDTGPVYGYFRSSYDEMHESHYVIQQRMVFDNLDQIRARLCDIHNGFASSLDISGRKSATWGQPWFTHYLKWKCEARKRGFKKNESHFHSVPRCHP